MADWLEGYARNGTGLIRAVKRSLGLQEDDGAVLGHWTDRVAWQTSALNPAKSAKKTQPAAVPADFWYGSRTKHMNEAMRQVVAAEGLPLIDWELSPLQPNGQPSQPASQPNPSAFQSRTSLEYTDSLLIAVFSCASMLAGKPWSTKLVDYLHP
jgi:hypothetical protein